MQVSDKSTEDMFPEKIPSKTYDYIITIIPAPEEGKIYSDQTGCFLYQSSRGTEYIFIVYYYDSNATLHAQLKNRTAEQVTKVWEKCHKILTTNGHKFNLHILDNEI